LDGLKKNERGFGGGEKRGGREVKRGCGLRGRVRGGWRRFCFEKMSGS